ncbi:MAG: winged helix-turn-helix transcriptional regulator [Candidatus Nanoarchaeia archaeon]
MEKDASRLDKYDRNILYELDSNSKQTISQIAKKIRLGKSTTRFRIERLASENIISNFYPVIDISKLGLFSVRVYFNFYNTNIAQEKEILNYLIKHKKVGVVAELETVHDVMISVIVDSIYSFDSFWTDFKKKFRENISDESINIFTRITHYKRKYLSDGLKKEEYKNPEIIGESKKEAFDDTDIKILSAIKNYSRLSALDIAKATNIPARTVIWHIKKMEEKKIIQNYRININLDKINRHYYKIDFKFDSLKNLRELREICQKNENIIFMEQTLSSNDLEIDVEIENMNQLKNLINEIKNLEKTRSIDIIKFRKYLKVESIPEIH